MSDTLLNGGNLPFLEEVYESYIDNPNSVDASWRQLFSNLSLPASRALGPFDKPHASTREVCAQALLESYRAKGHLKALLDPLKIQKPRQVQELTLSAHGLSNADLTQLVMVKGFRNAQTLKLADFISELERIYSHHVAVEFCHMTDDAQVSWLKKEVEDPQFLADLPKTQRLHVFDRLCATEAFESFLHKKYVTVKRFSLSGAESLIPMLDAIIEDAGAAHYQELVFGMAHRGRLNVLTNIFNKPIESMLAEFEGDSNPLAYLGSGDVKYHLGHSCDVQTRSGQNVHLTMAFNPSHLEFINPVVEGRVRAKQDRLQDVARARVLPVLMHGDAAFIGQGVVMETLNLSGLTGYATGGTIHVVINNQVGFTTSPDDSRSTPYCTEIAKYIEAPIFHVNGDDVEACVKVAELALRYRHTFKRDVVIDLVCFRRYGHNEGDEPGFTQPLMYQVIKSHPSVRDIYESQLLEAQVFKKEEANVRFESCFEKLQKAHDEIKKNKPEKNISTLGGVWKSYQGGLDKEAEDVSTAYPLPALKDLITQLTHVPEGFLPHPKVAKLLQTRAQMGEGQVPFDWGMAELLAYASLVKSGSRVRLTGQDVRRGTFSSRHAVLTCQNTGAHYSPVSHLHAQKGLFEIYDSPLCEIGVLGFEFGYSLDMPDALVVWEAQFGDFANVAQVIIDQFIATSADKWKRLSGLVMLLPHGYEGQGPEHSSARLERFLQMCATDNMQVCNLTTPAQIFHALRRQLLRPYRKPLVMMSPKSLLRHPQAISTLESLAEGCFMRLIKDHTLDAKKVKHVILCSGKVYYDLVTERQQQNIKDTAIIRLEQLYPFPLDELKAALSEFGKIQSYTFVQDEPVNMGAASFVKMTCMNHDVCPNLRLVGRKASASPATGSKESHDYEQKLLLTQAFTVK